MSSVMDVVSRLPPHVPEDLIIEIFLRLPAKSLSRFMAACREWHKIIKNPSFERDHFHRGGKFTSRLAYWYGCPCKDELDVENKCDLEIYEESGSINGDEIALERYEVPDLNNILSMHGPCYGIICVEHANNTLVLWNPTTKRSRLLPTCPLVTSYSEIGFGLDPITDDLKIVLFDTDIFHQRQHAIYNSRNGAWNVLESNTIFYLDSYVLNNNFGCAVLNGICYWIKLDFITVTEKKTSLLAFDMSCDLFGDIELPEILQDCDWEITLDIIDDNLALLSYEEYGSNIEIWLMKEQGCWTKHSVVKLDFHSYHPFRIWKRNQIFTWTKYMQEIFIYDLNSGNTRVLELGRMRGSHKLYAFPCQYKESLISV